MLMHRYRTLLDWKREEAPPPDFEHFVRFSGGDRIGVTAPHDGSPVSGDEEHDFSTGHVSPVELLVSSIASAQMLAYLRLCERNHMNVLAYRDDAVAEMPDGNGRPFAGIERLHVILRPRIVFEAAESQVRRAMAIRLLNEALVKLAIYDASRISIELKPVFEFAGD